VAAPSSVRSAIFIETKTSAAQAPQGAAYSPTIIHQPGRFSGRLGLDPVSARQPKADAR